MMWWIAVGVTVKIILFLVVLFLSCQDVVLLTVPICSRPETPNGAVLAHQVNYTFDAVAIFECKKHFYLKGSAILYCTSGIWTKPTFECIAHCLDFTRSKNRSIQYSKRGGQREATVSCDEGYVMEKGKATLQCVNGVWNGIPPVCRAPCPDPGQPEDAIARIGSDFTHDKTVTFQCRYGYRMIGQNTLKCFDGTWSSSMPECQAVTCKTPVPSNNHLIIHPKNWGNTKYVHGHVMVVACKNGLATGSPFSRCINGNWTRLKFSCIANCPRSVTIPNGRVIWKSLLKGGIIEIKCRPGFTLEGNSLLYCVNGNWNHKLPSCKATCSEPGGIQHGQKDGRDYRHGRKVTYSCRPKYVIDGANTLTCNNGKWDNKIPSCRVMLCNNPGTPINGQQKASRGYVYGAVIYFKCNDHFTMAGNLSIECRKDKTWTGTVPKCLAPCKELGEIQHGTKLGSDYKHGKKVRYRCWPRYVIDGANTLTCINGQWDNPVPICRVPCKAPAHPRYGRVTGDNFRHGSQVRYRCDKDFILRGVTTRTCNNGLWSPKDAPECILCSGDIKTRHVADCCTSLNKCPLYHGDCDSDDDCQEGLKCGKDNCPSKPGFRSDDDCCIPDCSGNNSFPAGHDCCTPSNPCREGHGDCDTHLDCIGHLRCGASNCATKPGFFHNDDCCYDPRKHCSGDTDIPIGHDCCTSSQPCLRGHGDCDSNDDCIGTLRCGTDNCPNKSGFFSGDDCCYYQRPHQRIRSQGPPGNPRDSRRGR